MVSLAEFSDTCFFVPCKRCAELLQEGDRFCRSCGKDQSDTDGAGDAESAAEPERGTSTRGGARSPIEMDFADTLQPEEQVTVGHPVPTSANEEVNPKIGLVRPDAFVQKEVLGGGGPRQWAGSSVSAYRLVIGIQAALVILLALALGHDLYLEKQSEAGRLQEFRANVELMQSALSRGDLSAAERALDVLDADYENHPDVQKLRQAFDRQVQLREQGQAVKRDQLRDAALEVSKALGLGEPPKAPMVATPAPEIGVADSKEDECNEALAALAMCPKR